MLKSEIPTILQQPSVSDDVVVLGLFNQRRSERLSRIAMGLTRYSVAGMLFLGGLSKFTAAEAQSIRPFLDHSPFMSWLPSVLGTSSASMVIGVVEIVTALLIVCRRFKPNLSALGSLIATGIFALTFSFLFTTPEASAPDGYMGGFLMKDLILLAASLCAAAEALTAARR